MSWTCTTEQAKTLEAIQTATKPGSGRQWLIEWDTDGRNYGTPDDLMLPCELSAITGNTARKLGGPFYIAPDGSIPGADIVSKTARELALIGQYELDARRLGGVR